MVCRHFRSPLTLSHLHLLFLHCDLECKIHKIKCDEEIIINNGVDICFSQGQFERKEHIYCEMAFPASGITDEMKRRCDRSEREILENFFLQLYVIHC
jgi:hypothetical protein